MADEFDLVKISELPAATTPGEYDVLAGVQTGDTKQFSFAVLLSWMQQAITATAIGAVPITRKINNKALSTDITLTAADIGAYALPSGGIPKTDLAQGVKDSLDNADSAYQMPSGGIPSSDMASAVQTSLGLADTAYQKPSSGIPATDLASGVIPTVPSAYTSNPEMDGTASPGSSGSWAKGDHVHPSDTTKAAKSDLTSIQATGTTNTTGAAIPAGAYFYLNGVLHKAKTQIDVNATFTVNTNCEVDTVSSGIKYRCETWTPNGATATGSGRCYYVVSGHLLIINIGVKLNSALSSGSYVSILPNVSSALGITPLSTAVVCAVAVARETNAVSQYMRIEFASDRIAIVNETGASISANKQIYGQLIIGIE